jgi:hypothetical protein
MSGCSRLLSLRLLPGGTHGTDHLRREVRPKPSEHSSWIPPDLGRLQPQRLTGSSRLFDNVALINYIKPA